MLSSEQPGLRFEPIGSGVVIRKQDFVRRLLQELCFGFDLVAQIRRHRPHVVMLANTPVPTMTVATVAMWLRGVPWVLWHQDIQGIAIQSFAGAKLHRGFAVAARVIGRAERWCARRSAAVVVIAQSFVPVHESWGTDEKVTVIPNWAPLQEIIPTSRHNAWSTEQGLDEVKTLLYSGTLGLKHNPELLVGLAARLIRADRQVRLVVVNEGPAVDVIRTAATKHKVPVTMLPFQPYERLSEVLGAGDVLIVLLDQEAGAFSVPSKTLSYLSAGRPILGLMPGENLAASLINAVNGRVLPPVEDSLDEAARWVAEIFDNTDRAAELGRKARSLAEQEFALPSCADRFEGILMSVSRPLE